MKDERPVRVVEIRFEFHDMRNRRLEMVFLRQHKIDDLMNDPGSTGRFLRMLRLQARRPLKEVTTKGRHGVEAEVVTESGVQSVADWKDAKELHLQVVLANGHGAKFVYMGNALHVLLEDDGGLGAFFREGFQQLTDPASA